MKEMENNEAVGNLTPSNNVSTSIRNLSFGVLKAIAVISFM